MYFQRLPFLLSHDSDAAKMHERRSSSNTNNWTCPNFIWLSSEYKVHRSIFVIIKHVFSRNFHVQSKFFHQLDIFISKTILNRFILFSNNLCTRKYGWYDMLRFCNRIHLNIDIEPYNWIKHCQCLYLTWNNIMDILL